MNERIIQLRKSLHLNQTEFARSIGLKQTSLSGIETGYSTITPQTIISICSVYNVNEHWLRTGEGNMFNQDDPRYNEFFEIYKNLSPALQDFLFDCACKLLEAQNKL